MFGREVTAFSKKYHWDDQAKRYETDIETPDARIEVTRQRLDAKLDQMRKYTKEDSDTRPVALLSSSFRNAENLAKMQDMSVNLVFSIEELVSFANKLRR